MVNNLTKCDLKTVTNIAITAIAAIRCRVADVTSMVVYSDYATVYIINKPKSIPVGIYWCIKY